MPDLISSQAVVERMLRAGKSFSEIEDFIEASSLEELQKAALWMLAWAHQDRASQLRLARETLALVGGVSAESALSTATA
ncbi:MAG: hypothetical protein ACXVHQ_30945 [Solirubrobacteraceae bacterium]